MKDSIDAIAQKDPTITENAVSAKGYKKKIKKNPNNAKDTNLPIIETLRTAQLNLRTRN